MKLLIDNAISPYVAKGMTEEGFSAIHVRDIDLQNAPDIEIFSYALKNDLVIVSADTDFGYLLSRWNRPKPSLIVFRKGSQRSPEIQVQLLLKNITMELIEMLENGAIIIIEIERIRIRKLPLFTK